MITDPDALAKSLKDVKYAITTADIIKKAAAIAHVGSTFPMPVSVRRAAELAIATREEVSKQQLRGPDSAASHDGHEYFIHILKKAFKILKASRTPGTNLDAGLKNARQESTVTSEAQTGFKIMNHFELLPVEEMAEATSPDSPSFSIAKAVDSNARESDIDIQLPEEMAKQEQIFVTLCFFKDISKIRKLLHDTWDRYKKGVLSLITAGVVSDLALTLVAQQAQDFADKYHNKPTSLAYTDFMECCLPPNYSIPESGNVKQYICLSETTYFLYLPVYLILAKATRAFRQENSSSRTYPQRVPIMGLDPLAIPASQEAWLKLQKNDVTLTQLLIEIAQINKVHNFSRRDEKYLGFKDQLWLRLHEATEGKTPTLTTVFAAQLFLDLAPELADSFKMTRHWADLSNRLSATLSSFRVGHLLDLEKAASRGRIGPLIAAWPKADKRYTDCVEDLSVEIMNIWTGSHRRRPHVDTDEDDDTNFCLLFQCTKPGEGLDLIKDMPPFSQARRDEVSQRAGQSWERSMEQGIVPKAQQAADALKANGVSCGVVAAKLVAYTERAGVVLANHHMSILCIAYLYADVRREGLLSAGNTWPEMDRLLELRPNLFFGSDPSSRTVNLCNLFSIRLGRKLASLAPYARDSTGRDATVRLGKDLDGRGEKLGPRCLSTTDLSRMLIEMFEGRKTPLQTMFEISKITRQSRMQSQTQIDPIPFLEQLTMWVEDEVPKMQIDYVSLTQHCCLLLSLLLEQIPFANQTSTTTSRKKRASKSSSGRDTLSLTMDILCSAEEGREAKKRLHKLGSSGKSKMENHTKLKDTAAIMEGFFLELKRVASDKDGAFKTVYKVCEPSDFSSLSIDTLVSTAAEYETA
ncbi:MAG: hypothetical protein M1828_007090 [Chrysothrix sp. TS-e1954]|nr:MAG: hypothetical protein M1828_007090 [Chrysothrix sp. TS-e1954]